MMHTDFLFFGIVRLQTTSLDVQGILGFVRVIAPPFMCVVVFQPISMRRSLRCCLANCNHDPRWLSEFLCSHLFLFLTRTPYSH